MTKSCISSLSFEIKFLSILTYLLWHSVTTIDAVTWSCANDVNGFKFDVDKIAGVWYEAVRVPPSDVPACVAVIAPNATEVNATYDLQLDYITNVNKQWIPTTENLTFPWDEKTQNGIFLLQYGSGTVSMQFTFKLVAAEYDSVAVVCYYSNYAPSVSMLKILTRQREVNATIVDAIQNLADVYGFGTAITWVEQSDRCNKASGLVPTMLVWCIMAVFGVMQILQKKL